MNKWKELPFISGLLVAVNVIVFVICMFTGNTLYRLGQLDVIDVLVRGGIWAYSLGNVSSC